MDTIKQVEKTDLSYLMEIWPKNQKNFLVYEARDPYTKHDLLFKQLIQTFFKEFLEAFFPYIYNQINFGTLTFLSEEVFTDVVEGATRRLDIVVETKLRDADALVVIHVEPQSYEQKNFNERMFQYYCFLYHEHRLPIIPIAIFSYDQTWNQNEFSLEIMGVGLQKFRYLTLHLRSKNWRDYINTDNPVAAALLSKVGFAKEERVQIKLEFLKMLVRLKVNPAEQRLLYGFFETYLKLNEEEEEELMREVKDLSDAKEILEIPISYEEKGKKIGRMEGIKKGRQEEKVNVAIGLLAEGISKEVIMKITKLSMDEINKLDRRN